MFYDPTFLLLIPALLLAFYAQFKVQSTFSKYSQVANSRGYTGAQVAKYILDDRRLTDVQIDSISGQLTDNYDPRDKKLHLSPSVYSGNSVAALGVAAHEVGHALQHAAGYAPLQIRNSIVSISNFGSGLAFPLFFLGIFMGLPFLMDIGIVLFSLAVIFTVLTLPVEFNASNRAIKILSDGNYLTKQEVPMAKAVLSAAALTYVASATMAVLNLIRLIILRNQRD